MRQEVQLVGVSLLQFEAVRTRPSRELAPRGHRLSSPTERERNAAKDKGTGVNMLQFVQSPTHLSHITLLQPFWITCERYIFLKNCVRSSLLCWLCFRVYMCMVEYVLWLCYTAPGVIIPLLTTLFEPLMPLKHTWARYGVISRHLLKHFKYLW